MERNDKNYARQGMREGHPGYINPEDVNHINPAKAIRGVERLDINQSGYGRDVSQQPADEHIESFSQITDRDDQTTKEFDTDDFKRVDERDNGDSSLDWDAEKNRTGRHK